MAEVVVVGQCGTGEGLLHIVEVQPVVDPSHDQPLGLLEPFGLDRRQEGSGRELRLRRLRVAVLGMPQRIKGQVIDALGQADQPPFPVVVPLGQAHPVGGHRHGVGRAVFEPVVSPPERFADRVQRIQLAEVHPGDLATDPAEVPFPKRTLQSTQDLGPLLLGGCFREIHQHAAVGLDSDVVSPEIVAAQDALPVVESELPVVPVAGQLARLIDGPLGQRVALMRTPVVDGVDGRPLGSLDPEHRQLPPSTLEHHRPGDQFIERGGLLPIR